MQRAKCLECLLLLRRPFLPKQFFPEGIGGGGGVYKNSSGNSGWVGGYFSGQKGEFPGRKLHVSWK